MRESNEINFNAILSDHDIIFKIEHDLQFRTIPEGPYREVSLRNSRIYMRLNL